MLNRHKHFHGLAIELKTPVGTGTLSDKQATFLDKLIENKYKVIISNDYEEVIIKLHEYFKDIINFE